MLKFLQECQFWFWFCTLHISQICFVVLVAGETVAVADLLGVVMLLLTDATLQPLLCSALQAVKHVQCKVG